MKGVTAPESPAETRARRRDMAGKGTGGFKIGWHHGFSSHTGGKVFV